MPTQALPSFAPFLIEPYLSTRVWGYKDLRPWYNIVADGDPIGEVWLTGDQCSVSSGPQAGKTLGELFEKSAAEMLGTTEHAGSPLLIKMLFAREKLSVQVHPDDAMAQKYGDPRGKTECWYAMAAEPDAVVAAGLKPGVTMEQIRNGIHNGTLEESLQLVPVAQGDMVFVDAGTVHAIWPGAIILETQQNSDLTYRMYDYGRPRELHIEKSLEATRLVTRAGKVAPQVLEDRTVLIRESYFCVERIHISDSRTSVSLRDSDESEQGLSYLFAAAGSARLVGEGFETVTIPERGIAAIPALSPAFTVENGGNLDLIRISPRWPK